MKKHTVYRTLTAILLVLAAASAVVSPGAARAQGGAPVTCPGFMPSRLVPGSMARDLPGGKPILMGQIDPNPSHPTVLPDGITVIVLDGPTCKYDTAQWQVDYNGSVGWLAEGEAQTYWLEPVAAPALGATYTSNDGAAQFDYPAGWQVVEQGGAVFVLEPGTTKLESGHFVIALYTDTHQVGSLANSDGTPAQLMADDAAAGAQQGVIYSDPVEIQFGSRQAAYVYTTSPSLGMDAMEFIVELGNGKSALLNALTVPGEASIAIPTALAIAQTLAAPGVQTTAPQEGQGVTLSGLGASLGGSGTAGSADTAIYTSQDGAFSFSYPKDWIASPAQSGNVVMVVSNQSVYSVSDLDSLMPGQLIVGIYPTLSDTSDYPNPPDASTTASTVVSYYASMGMIYGYIQEGAMNEFTAGGRQASSSLAHSTNHDRLVIAIPDGKGNFTVLIAFFATGDVSKYQQALIDLMGSVNAG